MLRSVLIGVLVSGGAIFAATHTVDVGGGLDELFIQSKWYGREGPYPQFGPVWHDTVCRWAQQGAEIRIPLVPGTTNTIEMRAEVRGAEGQRMRWYLDGRLVADLLTTGDLLYSVVVPAETVGQARWGVLP